MTTETEFREELKRAIRASDPSPDELRNAAESLHELAEKWEDMEDVL